jgi:protocatechuate 3,4-dioxygenase beta subunit
VRYTDPHHGPKDVLTAVTGADGAFELENPVTGGHLDVASPGWTSVLRPELPAARGARELVIVVARSVTLGGIVVDEQGRPVESASLEVPLPFGLRARFDSILDSASTVECGATSGPDGRFELRDAPLVPGVQLHTTHAAFLPDGRDLPRYDDFTLEIVLRRAGGGPERLVGRVVDPAGNPVEGAWVGFGAVSAKSGPGGEFALELETPGDPPERECAELDVAPLRAVKQGYLPAELARPVGGAWPEPLVLHLGGPPLAIRGRVVDADGVPVAGAEVWTDEETRFGFVEIDGGEMSMHAVAEIEGILRGDPWTRRFLTGPDGRFELAGLLPRDYHVLALDKRHLRATEARFPAGVGDVELRLCAEELHERVAGRVTNLSGEPIAGLEVVLERRMAGVQSAEVEGYESLAAKTDADGLFAFEDVSRAVNLVRVRGSELGLMGFEQPIGAADDVGNLELAVPLRVHVQVDGGEQPDFDRLAVLDEQGETLYLSVHHGRSSYAMREIPLHEGRTEPFSVSETATTLVLYAQGAEVRRVALELVRGELNTIRP